MTGSDRAAAAGAPDRAGRRSTDDHELVTAARLGDRGALETLLARSRPRIVVICRRILRDEVDAEDAAQEVLVAIVRGIPGFDGRSSFTTWSHRIATNVCLDEVRRRGRRPQGEPGEFDRLEGDQPDPGERAAAGSDRERLVAALDALPEEFRVPVVLRDVVDLDYAAIADELGLPIGTVRSRIARGRARLVAVLGRPAAADRAPGNVEGPTDVQRADHHDS